MLPAQATAAPSLNLEAVAAILLAAAAALATSLLIGTLTRRLLVAIEGERFHTSTVAGTTITAVRRVTFGLAMLIFKIGRAHV